MRFVCYFEKWFPVHQPVRPIEISIMEEDHEYDTQKEISIAMLINTVISHGISFVPNYNGHYNDYSENDHAEQGVEYFPQNMIIGRIALLYFGVPYFFILPDIKYQVKSAGKQEIPEA